MSSAVSQGPLLASSMAAAATVTEQATSDHIQDSYARASAVTMDAGGHRSPTYADQQQSWTSKMNGMMKELYDSHNKDTSMHPVENMDASAENLLPGNGSEHKMKYSPRPLSSPSGNGHINGNGLGEDFDITSPLSRHRLDMLRGDTLSQETSKLLREILQNKDKRLQQKLANGARQGLLGNMEESPFFSKFLHREGSMFRNGDLDNDNSSVRSGTPGDMSSASEDSDQENTGSNIINGVSQSDAMMKYAGDNNNSSKPPSPTELDNQNEDSNNTGSVEVEDSIQAKRARVENIITNMRPSPCRAPGDLGGAFQEGRRQKRKNFQPQQMDAAAMEGTPPKQRKTEKDVLRKQLKQMQEQLVQMQHKYLRLYEGERVVEHSDQSDSSDHEGKINGSSHKNIEKSDNPFKNPGLGSLNMPFDTSHLFSQANRLVEEQAALTKQTISKQTKVPVDMHGLAKTLKEEITNSIGVLVDNIVAKMTTSPKKKVVESSQRVQSPVKENTKEEKIKQVNNNKEKENVKTTSTRTKVTDKLLTMESPHKLFHDMPRPPHHIYAPPPYYPTHVPPPHSLFGPPPPEPEQTEALSLVLSTPKKKKVPTATLR